MRVLKRLSALLGSEEVARAREDKDNGDRAQAEAERRSDVSASNETWGDAGGRWRREKNGISSRRGGAGECDSCSSSSEKFLSLFLAALASLKKMTPEIPGSFSIKAL